MSHMPIISVITPCRNAADTLPATVASVQAQTRCEWEMICVDDGSTDDTRSLLDRLGAADPRIRVVSTPASGAAAARNAACRQARGRYILFLDADDAMRAEALDVLLRAASLAGPRTLVAAGHELLDHAGQPLGRYHFPSVPEFTLDLLLRGNRLPPMTLIPTDELASDPLDENQQACIDWDLWRRLAHEGFRCVTVPRVLFGYRLRYGSLSHRTDILFAAGRRMFEKWRPHAHHPDELDDVPYRWACACGALALASGDPHAIVRYVEGMPPAEQTSDFVHALAAALHHAFEFVHGTVGQTWSSHAEVWRAQIESWLRGGPLARFADATLACLEAICPDPATRFEAVREFLRRQSAAKSILIYGLGTNGLPLLEQIRSDPALGDLVLFVADDHAGTLTFEALGLPRSDPRRWERWPEDTVVVVTPNQCDEMKTCLDRIGGQEGKDYIALARVTAAVAAGA